MSDLELPGPEVWRKSLYGLYLDFKKAPNFPAENWNEFLEWQDADVREYLEMLLSIIPTTNANS